MMTCTGTIIIRMTITNNMFFNLKLYRAKAYPVKAQENMCPIVATAPTSTLFQIYRLNPMRRKAMA